MEMTTRGISFEAEKPIPVLYRGALLCHQRLDLFVGGQLVLELKSVDHLYPTHVAQVLSYLGMAGVRLGLLVNFNVPVLKQGIWLVTSSLDSLCVDQLSSHDSQAR